MKLKDCIGHPIPDMPLPTAQLRGTVKPPVGENTNVTLWDQNNWLSASQVAGMTARCCNRLEHAKTAVPGNCYPLIPTGKSDTVRTAALGVLCGLCVVEQRLPLPTHTCCTHPQRPGSGNSVAQLPQQLQHRELHHTLEHRFFTVLRSITEYYSVLWSIAEYRGVSRSITEYYEVYGNVWRPTELWPWSQIRCTIGATLPPKAATLPPKAATLPPKAAFCKPVAESKPGSTAHDGYGAPCSLWATPCITSNA
eukprot:gene14310-biopygen6570